MSYRGAEITENYAKLMLIEFELYLFDDEFYINYMLEMKYVSFDINMWNFNHLLTVEILIDGLID